MIPKGCPDVLASEQEYAMQMNTVSSILAALSVACLAGCATPDGSSDHARHHPGPPVDATAPGPAGVAAQGGSAAGTLMAGQAGCGMAAGSKAGSGVGCGMSHMDKEAMCAMYRGMRDAPTEAARQAMMDRQMQDMSPEMRQQHLEMMRQHCQ
jgi:hypothetical protein